MNEVQREFQLLNVAAVRTDDEVSQTVKIT
jgi:hypothetical protein